MAGRATKTQGSVHTYRRVLAERLRENANELEEMVFDRICALEEADSENDISAFGLRTVIKAALEYGIASVELGERQTAPPPPAVIDHARKAAWRSVPLHALHDRYFAGYSVFKHVLLREVESVEIVRNVQGSLDVVFRQVIQAIGKEHRHELQKRSRSSDVRRLERVQELLSGKILEAPDLLYPFAGTHVGIVGSGPAVSEVIRKTFQALSSQILLVSPEPNRVWAWIAVRPDLDSSALGKLSSGDLPSEICISIGEPAAGLTGWGLTHRQALSARSVALFRSGSITRFSEVALLASALGNELLRTSLTRRYLDPLSQGRRDRGKDLRDALRAYFSTNRHVSSAASLLNVKRHTVSSRLKKVEERLDCSLSDCGAELEVALRLEDLV